MPTRFSSRDKETEEGPEFSRSRVTSPLPPLYSVASLPKSELLAYRRYGVAVIGLVLVALIRLLAEPIIQGRSPFLIFLPAVLFSAWYGGAGPGLLTAGLGGIMGALAFSLRYPWSQYPAQNAIVLTIYVVSSFFCIFIIDAGQKAKRAAEQNARETLLQKEALTQSQNQLAAMLRSMGEAVIASDVSGNVMFMNAVAESLLGKPRSRCIGQNFDSLLSIRNTTTQTVLEKPVLNALHDGKTVALTEAVLVLSEGKELPVEGSLAPITDPQGSAHGTIVVFHDVTQRHAAEAALQESEARFRRLADSMPDISWTTQPDGIPDYFNRRWYEYTGLKVETGYGAEAWTTVLHPDDVARTLKHWTDCLQTGKPYEVEYRFREQKTGNYRWFLGRADCARDNAGRIIKWFGTCTDIDDMKQLQAERSALIEALKQERNQMENSIQTMERNETEIQNLNVRLRRTMSETHHRVKNNLQVIASLIEMQTGRGTTTVPTVELQRIKLHVLALAAIHDLLTKAARAGDVDHLNTQRVITELLMLLRRLSGNHFIRAEVEEIRLPVRQGTALAIIVNELVSNAMKFGKSEVILHLCQREGEVVLEVYDDGPGFPPHFAPEEFADTGLNLVQSLSGWDLAGKTIYANRPEGGAQVTVIFPMENRK